MASISHTSDGVENAYRAVLLGGFDGGVADVAAITGLALSIVYTTDDPVITPNQAVVIADGDIPTDAEEVIIIEEMVDQVNKGIVDYALLRTKVNDLINGNVFDQTTLGALTVGVNVSATNQFTITYTTDDPTITRSGTTTIADGDLTTDLELLDFFEEFSEDFAEVAADIANLHRHINQYIGGQTFDNLVALTALTSSATPTLIVYTTDDIVFTADQTITITDGDVMVADERNQTIEEVAVAITTLRADVLAAHTTYAAYLAEAGIS